MSWWSRRTSNHFKRLRQGRQLPAALATRIGGTNAYGSCFGYVTRNGPLSTVSLRSADITATMLSLPSIWLKSEGDNYPARWGCARTVWTRSSASQLKNQVAEYPKTHATILSSQVWRVAMPATRSSNCWAGTGSASRLFWISRSRVIAALRAP